MNNTQKQVRLTDENHDAILQIVRQCSFPVSITTVANACVAHGLPHARTLFLSTAPVAPQKKVLTTTALAKPLTRPASPQ